MIQNALKNWKTTSAGLTMIVGSGVHLVFAVKAGTADENTWTISLTAILGGIGLILAGDSGASATKEDLVKTKQQVADAVTTGDTSHLTKPEEQPPQPTTKP